MKRLSRRWYYGLWVPVFVALAASALCRDIGRHLGKEAMVEAGRALGALFIGVSLLVRGLDFIYHARRYPSFFKEHLPSWDRAARSATPTSMLLWGVALVLFGGGLMYIGTQDLLR